MKKRESVFPFRDLLDVSCKKQNARSCDRWVKKIPKIQPQLRGLTFTTISVARPYRGNDRKDN